MDSDLFPEDSAFHPDNVLPSILIMLARIYDVEMIRLRLESPERYYDLREVHAEGTFISPPPAFGADVNDE